MTETGSQAATGNLPDMLAENSRQLISKFRSDLLELEIGRLVQRYITTGPSFLLDDDRYYLLRARVAAEFALHPNEVLMVGSAKLGFSIVQNQRYQPFGEESDIDVAVVSSQLFDIFAQATFDYRQHSPYWPKYETFVKYMFRGWIRPDLLPPGLVQRMRWWEFFRALTTEGRFGTYQIRAGLYKSWHYLDSYHSICIADCKRRETT